MTIKNNLFILITGIMGTGKDAFGKALADRLEDARYMEGVTSSLQSLRDQVDRSFSPRQRFLYYLLANHLQSDEITKALESHHVVVNKYFYTTLAYHEVILHSNLQSFVTSDLTPPDKIILLTVPNPEMLERRLFEKTSLSGANQPDTSYLMSVQKQLETRLKNDRRTLMIDTGEMPLDDALDKVMQHINE